MTFSEKNKRIKELKKKISKVESEYNYNKAMQLALKLVINGTYGAFAHPKFVVSNKDIANAITAHGRDVILYMLNRIETYFYDKWHTDTDLHKMLTKTYIGLDKDSNSYMIVIHDEIIHFPSKYSEEYNDSSKLEKDKSSIINLTNSWNVDFNKLKPVEERKIIYDKVEITIKYERYLFDFVNNVNKIDGSIISDRENMPGFSEMTEKDKLNYDTKFHKEELCVYGDTDSLYLSFEPIMNSCLYDGDELEFILSIDRIYLKEKFINYLTDYSGNYGVKNVHDFELETVNKSAMHMEKKRYINNVTWEDGIFYEDMDYFSPKGIDIVRSSTPVFVRGQKQKGGIWDFIDYLFRNPDELNVRDILRIMKDLKNQFIAADIEDISMTTSLSNYKDKIIDDQTGIDYVKGAHFSVRAAALHNFLLNKNSEFKTKYDLLKGGRIKWYFCNHPIEKRFAYMRSFHPYEIVERENLKIDYDEQFSKTVLAIANKFLEPIGLPDINKRLSVLNSLFGGSIVNEITKAKDDFDDFDDWSF